MTTLPSKAAELMLEATSNAGMLLGARGTILKMNKAAKILFRDEEGALHHRQVASYIWASYSNEDDHVSSPVLKHPNESRWEKLMEGLSNDKPEEFKARCKAHHGTQFGATITLMRLLQDFRDSENMGDITTYSFCVYVQPHVAEIVSGHDKSEMRHLPSADQDIMAAIIDASFEPMFQINSSGIILMCNKAAVDIFGWTRGEFIGQNISMVCDDQHAGVHNLYLSRYLRTGVKRVIGRKRELTGKKKDGTLFPVELGVSEILANTGEIFFCGFLRDLSKQKQITEESLHRLHLVDGMVNASFDSMFLINKDGIIQMVNDAASQIFGWSKEEFLNKNISMIAERHHAENHCIYLSSYLASGEKRVIGKRRKLTAVKKDGIEFPIELGVKEVKAPWGDSYFCGFVKDLTQDERNHERLQRKEQLTSGMLNSSFDPMFQINERGTIYMVNQAAMDYFGWSREEFLGSNISMICGGEHSKHHNEYLEHYLRTGEKRVIGKRRQLNAVRKDGTEFPIELGIAEVQTIWGEKFFCGFVRDIRREKSGAAEILEKEQLLEGIIQTGFDPMFAIDDKWNIYLTNTAATKELGWSTAELVGNDIRLLMPEGLRAKQVNIFETCFQCKNKLAVKEFIDNMEFVRKNGSILSCQVGLSEIVGQFSNLLASNEGDDSKGSRIFTVFLHGAKDSATASDIFKSITSRFSGIKTE